MSVTARRLVHVQARSAGMRCRSGRSSGPAGAGQDAPDGSAPGARGLQPAVRSRPHMKRLVLVSVERHGREAFAGPRAQLRLLARSCVPGCPSSHRGPERLDFLGRQGHVALSAGRGFGVEGSVPAGAWRLLRDDPVVVGVEEREAGSSSWRGVLEEVDLARSRSPARARAAHCPRGRAGAAEDVVELRGRRPSEPCKDQGVEHRLDAPVLLSQRRRSRRRREQPMRRACTMRGARVRG